MILASTSISGCFCRFLSTSLLLAFGVSAPSQGAISLSSASSNLRLDGVSPAYNLYGAFAYLSGSSPIDYNCSDVNANCNTCIGAASDPLMACSLSSSFASATTSLSFSSSTALTATSQWLVCATSSSGSVTDITNRGTVTNPTGSPFTWTSTWSVLCEYLVGDTTCGTSGKGTLTVGLASGSTQTCSSGLSEKIDFKATLGGALGTSGVPSLASGSYGEAYLYGLFPGDEKVYLTEEDWTPGSGFPKNATSGLSYTRLHFFYSQLANPADAVNPALITNGSPAVTLSVSTEGEIEKDYLEGLANDEKFCFRIGNENSAGVIEYFTPDANIKCEIPSEVVGLLSDKKCFIATAAYGSNMDSHVTSFRQFRNQFLIPTVFGKWFTKTYYRLSPPLAKFIATKEPLRALTRWLLWPLLAFAEVSLAWGLGAGFFLLLGGGLLSVFLIRVFLKRLADGRIAQLRAAPVRRRAVFFSLFFVFLLGLFFGASPSWAAEGENDVFSDDIILEDPLNDAPPNEPPYVTSEPNFEGTGDEGFIETTEVPIDSSIPVTKAQEEPKLEAAKKEVLKNKDDYVSSSEEKLKTKEGSEFIKHPNAKKGLYLIDGKGTYHYKTIKKTQPDRSISLKYSSVPVPLIESELDNGDVFAFEDMYGEDNLSLITLEFSYNPFPKIKRLYGVLGVGFSTATGSGFFKGKGINDLQPRESFNLYIIPVSLGATFRFEFKEHQWAVPYLSAAGIYYGMAEIRDDNKRSSFSGSPAAMGAAGVLLNIASWDKSLQFTLDREYGISDIWLELQFRGIYSANPDIDFTGGLAHFGIAADY